MTNPILLTPPELALIPGLFLDCDIVPSCEVCGAEYAGNRWHKACIEQNITQHDPLLTVDCGGKVSIPLLAKSIEIRREVVVPEWSRFTRFDHPMCEEVICYDNNNLVEIKRFKLIPPTWPDGTVLWVQEEWDRGVWAPSGNEHQPEVKVFYALDESKNPLGVSWQPAQSMPESTARYRLVVARTRWEREKRYTSTEMLLPDGSVYDSRSSRDAIIEIITLIPNQKEDKG